MKQTVTEYQFVEAFRHAGRESQFSVNARRALFDYLESFEHDSGTELELDPIAVCCDFAEYDSALDAARAYGYQFTPGDPDSVPLEWLQERTTVLTVPHQYNVVIQNF